MLTCLTGTKASGKGVVADILKKRGFVYASLSNKVREEATRRGLATYTTKDLQDIANDLRAKHGPGVFAKMAYEQVRNEKDAVLDGIRNPGELEALKDVKDCYLIGVDAPQRVRFERFNKRRREEDFMSWEDFLKMDDREWGKDEPASGLQVGKCMEQADYLFWEDFATLQDAEKAFAEGETGFLNLFGNRREISLNEELMRQAAGNMYGIRMDKERLYLRHYPAEEYVAEIKKLMKMQVVYFKGCENPAISQQIKDSGIVISRFTGISPRRVKQFFGLKPQCT